MANDTTTMSMSKVRGKKLFSQFKSNLIDSYSSKLNLGILLYTIILMVAAYAVNYS